MIAPHANLFLRTGNSDAWEHDGVFKQFSQLIILIVLPKYVFIHWARLYIVPKENITVNLCNSKCLLDKYLVALLVEFEWYQINQKVAFKGALLKWHPILQLRKNFSPSNLK